MRLRPATVLVALSLVALIILPFFVQGTYYHFLGIVVFGVGARKTQVVYKERVVVRDRDPRPVDGSHNIRRDEE